jgi:alpha-D-xyloside xylohydrolase
MLSRLIVLVGALVFLANLSLANADVVTVTRTDRGVSIALASETIELQAWGTGTIRVQIAPAHSMPKKISLDVIDRAASAQWAVHDEEHDVRLQVGGLTARFNKIAGTLSFVNSDGQIILDEASPGRGFSPALNPARDGLQITQTFVRDPDERLFGMGVIADELSKPIATVPLLNGNASIQVPILYSSRGYGLLWDNASKGALVLTPKTVSWQSSAGDSIDYYVMAGPSADQVISEYRALTGNAPLFPKWAYGFWFSKNRFRSQDEILKAGADFRAHHIPIDLIIQDYYYWLPNQVTYAGQNWGSYHFDQERYPDPKMMISRLHDDDHLHFMAVAWPTFDPATDHAKELAAADALFPPGNDSHGTVLRCYDPFGRKAREIYGRQVMESLLPLGVDGFWVDGAEPAMDKAIYAAQDSSSGPISRVMNAFPLMHTTALYEAERATSSKRVVLLPRSAWVGMQRNAASNWTTSVSTLEKQQRNLSGRT